MVRRFLALPLIAGAVLAWPSAAGPARAQGADAAWPMVGRDAAHGGTVAAGPDAPYRRAWAAEVPGGPRGGPVVAAGLVVVVGATGVAAYDLESGETRWEQDRSEGPTGPPAVAGDVVVHASGRGERAAVVGRSLSDGQEAWSITTGGAPLGGPAVDGDRVYVGLRTGEVLALEADSGEVAWRFEADARVETSPAVAGGLVIAVSEDFGDGTATVHAVDAATGEQAWTFSPAGVSVGVSSPAIGDETVFLGMGDGAIHALDLATGEERWTTRARAAAFSAGVFTADAVPAAGADLVITDIAHVYRLDPATGDERWSFRIEESLPQTSPAVSGSTVVVGDATGTVSAIDLRSGLRVWTDDLGAGPVSAVAAAEDRVVVAVHGENGPVVALEHDPGGTLTREQSQTTLSPVRALLNFAAAFAMVGAVVVALFRYAVPWLSRLRGPGPGEPTPEPEEPT